MATTFGNLLKRYRLRARFGLRKFAQMLEMQPSNLCALEHNRRKPPEEEQTLRDMAIALNLLPGSEDWKQFFDAARSPGDFPADVRHLAKRKMVPVLLRTIDDNRLSDEDLKRLIEEIESRQGG